MIGKYLFKRKFIKILQEEIWREDINCKFAERAISELQKINDKLEIDAQELFDKAGSLIGSNKREDRDEVKRLQAREKGLKAQIARNGETIANTIESIDSKRATIEVHLKKIEFVTKNF